MAYKIKVQDGIIVYAACDPALDVKVDIAGELSVSKFANIGSNEDSVCILTTSIIGQDLTITTAESGRLNISPLGNLNISPTGAILLNGVSWPAINSSITSGSFVGASALNTLAFYPFVIAYQSNDALTITELNNLYPTIQPGQMVVSNNVIYYCVGVNQWRLIGAAGGSTPSSSLLTIKTVTGNYTLQIADADNTLIRVDSLSSTVITIANDSIVNIPIGSTVLIGQNGAGPVSISADSGVTIDTPDSYSIGKRFGKITAIKTAANHWEIEGNLVPL